MSSTPASSTTVTTTAFTILGTLSFCHFLNDMLQSLLPAIYPVIKQNYSLNYWQIGLITLTYQLTASILQPLVGAITDRRPQPYSLAVGMAFTGVGLLLLGFMHSYVGVLIGAACVGTGSSIFHPESSRIARLASGGRHGFAQSVFQVGGNIGSATGPLLAALIVVTRGQAALAWFALFTLVGMFLLAKIGRWYQQHHIQRNPIKASSINASEQRGVYLPLAVLLLLIFSKYFYFASFTSYYTLYLIDKFHVDVQDAQLRFVVFLSAVAAGTLLGGSIGDRIGRKAVIWFSILGTLPFTLLLPHANLFWTTALTIPIGLIMASAFPAIVVFAQELLPGRVGTISGLFFGFAFGVAGIGAAVLGELADRTNLEYVYGLCAYLPALGLLAALLPRTHRPSS